MKVEGKEIPGMALSAGLAAMAGLFTTRNVEMAMRNAGCGDEAYRAADRLVQQERKAGRIALHSARHWERVS